MYTLYNEHFRNDEKGNRFHYCEKTKFETLEEAKEEMLYQYDILSPGNNSTLLLNRSALIIHHDKNDRYDHMVLLSIEEAES